MHIHGNECGPLDERGQDSSVYDYYVEVFCNGKRVQRVGFDEQWVAEQWIDEELPLFQHGADEGDESYDIELTLFNRVLRTERVVPKRQAFVSTRPSLTDQLLAAHRSLQRTLKRKA